MAELPDASVVVAVLVVAGLLAAGPTWAGSTDLGEGTATVDVVAPSWLEAGSGPADHVVRTSPGRFGTAADYLRTPDLVADVTNVTGRPELYYDVAVPAIGVDPDPVKRTLDGAGRYRLHLPDVALGPADFPYTDEAAPPDGTYTGRVLVRVQSFSGDHVVANRTVEVIVDR